jgi:hypothetical protein
MVTRVRSIASGRIVVFGNEDRGAIGDGTSFAPASVRSKIDAAAAARR